MPASPSNLKLPVRTLLLTLAVCASLSAAERAVVRLNHAGRNLGRLPVLKAPVAFKTPEADQVLAAMQIMPPDSAWNEVVSDRPVHPDSAAIIARIRGDLPGRTTLHVFPEMNFVLVPDNLWFRLRRAVT
jgi:hypothetical protein